MNINEEARNVRDKYERTLQTVRGNQDLTDAAKRERIRAAYHEARIAMERLRQSAGQEGEEKSARLYKKAFGQTFDTLTAPDERMRSIQIARDSLDRAEAAQSPQDALKLLSRADLTGDTPLMKAVALKAFEMSWGNVLDEVQRVRPAVGNAVTELREHESGRSPQNNLETHFALSINQPPEV